MSRKEDERRALAADAWRGLFDFFVRTRAQRDHALARLDLTPNDARALATLRPRDGVRMSELAETWGTEASSVTWAVTRLEQRGLVERTALESDRRVKMVRLTRRGRDLSDRLLRALYAPPPELEALEDADLEALRAIFAKARGPREDAPERRGKRD